MPAIYLPELDAEPFPAMYEGVLRHFISVRPSVPEAIAAASRWLDAMFDDGASDGFYDWLHSV